MAESTALAGLFGTTDFMVPIVLGGLKDEQARHRPRGEGGPSIAWTVGHLLHYRISALKRLGVTRENPFGDDFGTGSATDGSDYPTVAELKSAWEEVSTEFMAGISGVTEEALDVVLEDGWSPDQTLRDQIVFLAWHEGYHLGAIGQMRKTMGLPGPAEAVQAMQEEQSGS